MQFLVDSLDRFRSRGGTFSIVAKILAIEHPRHGIPHTRHSNHSEQPYRPFQIDCDYVRSDCSFHMTDKIESRD